MNDQDLKNLFQSMKYGEPSDLDQARWRRVLRDHVPKNPSEWRRLAVACLIGIFIGAVSAQMAGLKGGSVTDKNLESDATIEHIYVNTQ